MARLRAHSTAEPIVIDGVLRIQLDRLLALSRCLIPYLLRIMHATREVLSIANRSAALGKRLKQSERLVGLARLEGLIYLGKRLGHGLRGRRGHQQTDSQSSSQKRGCRVD